MKGMLRRASCVLPSLLLGLAIASGMNASADTVPPLPPGMLEGVLGDDGLPVPVDLAGLPSRRLSDEELRRVMLHLSRVLDAAAFRMARCHAEGTPAGHHLWRFCVERP